MDKKEYDARNFSQSSYDINDEYAKKKFTKFLLKKGYTLIDSEENFDHDIKALNQDGEIILFELEVKTGYPFKSKKTFPFSTVSFTGRKERLHKINEFHYVIICRETNWAISCPSTIIYNPEYTQELYISTNTREGEDKFFRVPKEKCSFFIVKK